MKPFCQQYESRSVNCAQLHVRDETPTTRAVLHSALVSSQNQLSSESDLPPPAPGESQKGRQLPNEAPFPFLAPGLGFGELCWPFDSDWDEGTGCNTSEHGSTLPSMGHFYNESSEVHPKGNLKDAPPIDPSVGSPVPRPDPCRCNKVRRGHREVLGMAVGMERH